MQQNKNVIIQSGGSIIVGGNLSLGDKISIITINETEWLDVSIKYLMDNKTDEAVDLMKQYLSSSLKLV